MMTNAQRAMDAVEADVLVASDPSTVAWLTGFAQDVISGPSTFACPPLAVVRGGEVTLVCSEDEAPAAASLGAKTATYEGFTTGLLDPAKSLAETVRGLSIRGRISIEADSLPLAVAHVLEWNATGALVDVGQTVAPLRAVKTLSEIEAIRRSIAICDVGQAAARAAFVAGLDELAAWSEIQAAMEAAAGERLLLLCDIATGERSAEIGGPPSGRVLAEGDLVICDLVPRRGAFWGDSCSTIAVGEPPVGARDTHQRACDTLAELVGAVRPGVVAGELDRLGRASGLGYPHHTGHGIGVANHEAPRIVPGDATVLEPGMVVALEPGHYESRWGLRVEQVCLVTDDGCEVLSGHRLSL